MRRKKKSYFPMSSWRLLIAVIVVVVSLAAVLVVFGKVDFPKAQKTDPSKLTECQKRVLQGTVRILGMDNSNRTTVGSGVVIGEAIINGKRVTVILTAAHVAGIISPIVENYDSNGNKLGTTRDVQVIKRDTITDLAVMVIPYNPGLPPVKIAEDPSKVGDKVDIYGCLGTEGTIPCMRGRSGYEYFIENISRIIDPGTGINYEGVGINARPESPATPPLPVGPTGGTSGGPVTNKNGEIIGICSTQTMEEITQRPVNIVNCPSLKTMKEFLKNLPITIVYSASTPEEKYLEDLMKELEKVIKNAGAPMAPELTPIP